MDVPVPFSPPLEDETVPTPRASSPHSRARALQPDERRSQWRSAATARWGSTGSSGSTSTGCARERLARAKASLERSELGALLCFDMSNIRYITATHIGTWAVDKYIRFCLLPQGDEPIMWDFGSAARHHKLYSPWLGEERSRAGISTLRGAGRGPRRSRSPRRSASSSSSAACSSEPLGVDIVELPVLRALEAAGITVVDGQALMQDVRKIKTRGRDHAAEHRLHDGRRRLRRAVPRDAARHSRERLRRARQQACCSSSAPSTSRASTRSPASAAARIRTSSPTACCGRAIRRTSTSSTPTTAIARATTARSRSAARRARWSTRTSAAATSSTTRSR